MKFFSRLFRHRKGGAKPVELRHVEKAGENLPPTGKKRPSPPKGQGPRQITEGRERKGGVSDPPTTLRPAPPTGQGGVDITIFDQPVRIYQDSERTIAVIRSGSWYSQAKRFCFADMRHTDTTVGEWIDAVKKRFRR